MISFFNGLKTYGKKNQLKNKNALVIFLSVLNSAYSIKFRMQFFKTPVI